MANILNDKALDAFLGKKADIDLMLSRLSSLSDDHFNTHPEEINWGDVGTLDYYAAKLREISDFAFGEGECAK